jgi:thioredoxin 1
MKQIGQQEFNTAIEQGIVVVDFFAVRCGPCQMIAPYLDEMSEKLAWQVSFYKVDVDQEQTIAATQWIQAMPTMKIFKDGQEVKTIVGADLKALRTALQEMIGG